MVKNTVLSAFLFVLSVFAVSIFADPAQASAAPVVKSVAPAVVSVVGGDSVTIIGTGFEATSKVELNGVATTSAYVDAQTMTFTTAATVAGAKRVTVVNADGQRFNLESGLSFIDAPPTLTSITPNKGPLAGAQSVTVTGTNFSMGKKQATQVAAGDFFSCGVYDGAIYCWGLGTAGQLGNNTSTSSTTPVPVNTDGTLAGKTIKSLTAGNGHACALATDGSLSCWGMNGAGQLGNASNTRSTVPVAVTASGVLAGLTITSVNANATTTCATASDGNVYCWGLGTNGQLGNGGSVSSNVPVLVTNTGVTAGKFLTSVAVGYTGACAVASTGQAYCWGRNTNGELGNGTTTNSTVPVTVDMSAMPAGKVFSSTSMTQQHTCALATDGSVFCWGAGSYIGRSGTANSSVPVAIELTGTLVGTTMLSISAKNTATCAVASDNNTYCWGLGTGGQRGDGTNATLVTLPKPVVTSGALAGLSTVSLSTGSGHSCVVASNNQLYCWGTNTYGQIGDNTAASALAPAAANVLTKSTPQLTIDNIPALNTQFVSSTSLTAVTPGSSAGSKTAKVTQHDNQSSTIANGYTYASAPILSSLAPSSAAISGGDTITITGSNLSTGSQVKMNGAVVATAAYINDTTLTFTAPSQLYARNVQLSVIDAFGQESNATNFVYSEGPITVTAISPAKGPAAGGQAVTVSGTGFSVGVKEISQISSGGQFSCGIYEQQAYCWGRNPYGELGNGTTTLSSTPVAVDTSGVLAGKTIKSISVGTNTACAIASDDLVYCWGRATEGQLGNNTVVNSSVPVAVSRAGVLANKTIKSVSSGQSGACVIASDDLAYCWGAGSSGQLGNNTVVQSNIPVTVTRQSTLSGKTIKSISVGQSGACLIASDNQVYCWGAGGLGQLGNNTTTAAQSWPIAVTTSGAFAGKTIKTITTGGNYSCAIASDDLAYCWGSNANYQLGINLGTTQLNVPTAVYTAGTLNGKTMKAISAGSANTCAIASDDLAYCWGGSGGVNGDGSTVQKAGAVAVSTAGVLAGNTMKSVTVGTSMACSTTSDNRVYCWGVNTGGQLGNGQLTTSTVPVATSFVMKNNLHVTIGGVAAKNVTYVSPTSLTAVTPAQPAGIKDTAVTRYDNQSATRTANYEYVPGPSSVTISPSSGLITGGDTITITGSGFDTDTKIKFDDVYLGQFNLVNSTTITFVTPSQSNAHNAEIVTENLYGEQSTSVFFNYTDPPMTISSVSPANGPVGGGGDLTITGTNFTSGTRMTTDIVTSSTNTCGVFDQAAYCWGTINWAGTNNAPQTYFPQAVVNDGVLAGKTIKSLASTQNSTCAIASDDQVYCWGVGSNGQLGRGTTSSSAVPVAVSKAGVLAGKTVKSVSGGNAHYCAVASDDLAYCWGSNGNGQLGNNSTVDATTPVAVSMTGALSGKTIKSISAGANSTCAVASDSQAYCWGYNVDGQLGNGTTTSSSVPVAVVTNGVFSGKTITSVVTSNHTCAIASDNLAYCWGLGTTGQLGAGTSASSAVPIAVDTSGVLYAKNITSLSLGPTQTCSVASDYKAYCWGNNQNGVFGNNSTTNSNVPVAVDATGALLNKSIKSISVYTSTACAVSNSNKAYCWGVSGTNGLLGNGGTATSLVPVAVGNVASRNPQVTIGGNNAPVTQIASPTSLVATIPAHASGIVNTSVARYDNTTAIASNSYTYGGIPSIGSASPNKAPKEGGDTITVTGTNFTDGMKVKVGSNYAAAVTVVSGTTLTFVTPAAATAGTTDIILEDIYGQSTTLTGGFTYQNAAMTISSLSPTGGPTAGGQSVTFTGTNFFAGFKQLSGIATGWNHSCGIYEQQAYCWGSNSSGQLGNGTQTSSQVPVPVSTTGALAGKTIKSISAGSEHTCALASDNLTYCWGGNSYGQLGINSTTRSLIPVAINTAGVLNGKTIKVMDASYVNTCVVASDDQAYCWGFNFRGQLGNGTTTQSNIPVAVTTSGVLSGKTIKSIAITLYHACVIASDDQAYCWGENSGKLGNNSNAQSNVPVAVYTAGALSGKTLKTIAPGYSHTCALSTDNIAFCWGTGDEGQLGNGSSNPTLVPTIVTTSGALSGKTISTLMSSDWNSCVTTTEGKGYCWGRNTDGQLGNGTTTVSNVPTPIDMTGALAGKSITTISGSYYHTCAQASDNQAYCWGQNNDGRLGNNTVTDSTTPVAVSNIGIAKTMAISFGGTPATNVQIVSPTQMTAVTPARSAGTTDVIATSYDDQTVTKSNAYTFTAPPVASSISPTAGFIAGGDTVTMTGSGFAGNLKVKIGDIYSPSVIIVNGTTLTFTTPSTLRPGTFTVTVEDDYGQTSVLTNAYTYKLQDPNLTTFTPAAGPMGGGTTVTLSGSNFVVNPDGATWYQVRFNGTLATNVTYVNSNTLTAVAPAGTIGTAPIAVSSPYTNTVTYNSNYTYTAQSYRFSNATLNLSQEEVGTLTVQARNASNNPVTSPTPTTVTLTSTSTGGAFATNLSEDISTRWNKTSVVIPANQATVTVYYKDATSGTPTITGTVQGVAPFTQIETISSPFRFVVSGVSDPIKAGVPSSVTIRVTDKNGVQRNDYTGTINFSSTDPAATVPASYTMKTTDYGIKTFTNGVTMGSVGEYCVTATDSIEGAVAKGQQCAITVQPANNGTISKLAIITPEQRITAGHYSSPITIQTQDSTGLSIPVAAEKHIYLYSPSATGEFSKDGVTWSGTMPFDTTIAANASSTNIYYRDSAAHTTSIKAMDNATESTGGDFGWLNANQSITTGLSPPTKMRVTGLQAMVSGQKSHYLVELLDDAGNLVSTDSDVTIRVGSDTATSLFYFPTDTSTGVSGPTEFTIPSGLTGTSIAFSDTTISTATDYTTLTFTDGRPMTETVRLQDATKDVQIVTALPSKITLTVQESSIEAGDSTPVDIQLFDSTNQVAPAVETTTIGLTSSTPSGQYSLTQTPFTPVTSATITQGQSSKRVYFRDTLAGTSTLSANRAGMTATPDQVDITSSDTENFGITPLSTSTPVDTASAAFTVSSYDVFGNIVIQDTNRSVYPYSNQTTTRFSASATGPWTTSPVTILAGQSSVQFYAKDSAFYGSALQLTASDKATLDNPDVDIRNATATLAITSQPIASIAITSTQQTTTAGTVSNKIDIELRKTDGTPALQNGTTNVALGIANGKFVATSSSTATAITSINIPQGTAAASFYYYGEKSGAQTITATTGSSSVTQPLIVQAAAPNKIVYESSTPSVAPNASTAAIHAIIRDQFNNNATFSTDKTMVVSSSCGTGSFSLSNTNWQAITSINLAAGASDATFYYKDSAPGDCTLTTTIAGITAATQQVSISSYAVDGMVITTQPQTIKAGEKTDIITVELRKADGTPAYQNGATQLQLQVPNGQFYLNTGDTQTISTVTIAAGQASASFYYSSTLAGSRAISVSMAGVANPVTQQVTVTPEAPYRVIYTTQPQTVPEGSPSSALHVVVRDSYGNTSPLTSETTLNLASNCVTGTFSENDVDWQPVTDITLPVGSSDATFYYKAMIQGSCSLTVSANGLISTSQTMTITDANFPVRIGLTAPSTTLTKGQSSSLSITLLDQNGDISPAKVRTTVYMTTSSDGVFSTASVVFNPGTSTNTVTYRNNVAGQVTIYARDQVGATDTTGSLIDTSASLTYVEGAATSVKLQAAASTAQAGQPTTLTTTLLNSYGLSVPATSDTTISLSSNNQTGSFYDANGNATSQITIPAGQSQATASYRQTQIGAGAITAQSAGLTQSTTSITIISQDNIAEIRFLTAPTPLEVGVNGLYRVGLYDEFGNITVTTSPLTLYASSDENSVISGNGQFIINAGSSNGQFNYKQNNVGPFTITVDDSQTGTSGALSPITHTGNAIAGNPKSFRFTPATTPLERGGVTDAITIELLNANDQVTPATGNGQTITLGAVNGAGKYAMMRNGNFTSQLTFTIPDGQTSVSFYYRNDTATAGTQSMPATGTFSGVTVSKVGLVTLRYGDPTQLVYLTQPIVVDAYAPSEVLTIQQQNQYGIAVPVTSDKTIYLTSDTSTSRFGSSKVNWDVNSVVMRSGASTANFYYQDTAAGERTITASDTLPLAPDVLLVNAVQSLSVLPSSNIPRVVNNFLVTNISDPQSQGTKSSLVLIARDVDGYIVENYNGTVSFSSDDPDAQLPQSYTFIPSIDKGVKVFTNQVAFTTEGEKTVIATDVNGIQGEQTEITVGEGNTNPITALAITQPTSPVTIAPNTTSPNITVELRDGLGNSTNAPAGGLQIRVTSTTSTGQFATSAAGPWVTSLVTTVTEGLSYANLYYRDSAVGNATVTASDWIGAIDSGLIDNASLEVLIHRTYVAGEHTIQTLNALGEYETSAQLFARNSGGAINGKVTNNFSSRNLVNDQLVAVEWRTQWRQGVNLLKSDTASNQTNFAMTVDPIQTVAGASDFYAVAETTETTFADTFGIVSKQLQTVVSPWKTSIETRNYALNNEDVAATISFRNNNVLTKPATASIFLLAADATSTTGAARVTGVASPDEILTYTIPAGIATLGGSYKLLAITYDTNGNTTSQVVSDPFIVLETPPIEETTPITPVAPIVEVTPPAAPTEGSTPTPTPLTPTTPPTDPETTTPAPDDDDAPIVGGATSDNRSLTAAIVATYGATAFLGVFLIRESYKEWARIRRLRSVLKREQQLATDKNTFLSLASHYLRTPITILDAAASMVPASVTLQSVAATLRKKADALLENGAASSLADIQSPDIKKATRSAFMSVYFWLPIVISIVLTVAVTVLLNAAANGTNLSSGVVYTIIIAVAIALIISFGARTLYINKEVALANQAMKLHRAQLFNAKTNFILAMQDDLSNEIAQLHVALAANGIIPANVKALIVDGTQRLEELVAKLTVIAQINGMSTQTETFTPQALVQSTIQKQRDAIADKNLTITQTIADNGKVSQDQRMLRYVTGTVLDNAVMFSAPGSKINVTTAKHGKQTQVSITNENSSFGSAETLNAMFQPFNHATHENDLTVEGIGLSLYLDKLIMEHLGGTISASNSSLHNSASINISFPSVK